MSRHSLATLSLAAVLWMPPLLAQAQEPAASVHEPSPRIQASGQADATAVPDLALVQLTVMRAAPAAADAVSQSNEAVAAVTAALRGEFGMEARDLQTAGFQIVPQYRYENRDDGTQAPPVLTGYEVRNTLSLRVRDTARVGEMLDRAVALGVNEGGSIQFTLDDTTALADEARGRAVEQARRSAEVMARAAGLELGRVLRIEDLASAGQPPIPIADMRMMAMPAPASAGSQVPVELGETSVSANVRVTFELRD